MGASQQVFQLLDRLAEMPPCGQDVPRGRPEGADLDLRSVSFAYPSRPEIQVRIGLRLLMPVMSCSHMQWLNVWLVMAFMKKCFPSICIVQRGPACSFPWALSNTGG